MNTTVTSAYEMVYPYSGSVALKPVCLVNMGVVQGGLSKESNARPTESHELSKSAAQRVRSSRHHQASTTMRLQCLFAAVASVLLVVMVSASWLLSDQSVATRRADAISFAAKTTLVVSPGDSLWSIAEGHGISGYETVDVVSWIKEANGLQTATLQPGETLIVPA